LAEKRRCSQRMDCGMRPCRSSPVSWILGARLTVWAPTAIDRRPES
jgi:hypothetical protein